MSILEAVKRVHRRFFVEAFDLDPIVDPPPPRAERPTWERDTGEVHLRVLSLNVWGLPTAPKCTERAAEVAKAINGAYELVVLQEVWHRRERSLIIHHAERAGYHYYHYFHPAIGFPLPIGPDSFGTGLLVLSKFPISSALYHAFSLSGRPYALHEADFVANKGVGILRLETPVGQVDLYVTHLLANYNELGRPGDGDRYLPQRVGQAYELARFITSTARSPFVLVCGDFNSPSDCLVLRIPRELAKLRDAYTDTNESDGLTFATEDNKFSHGEHPMRMDYILYRIDQEAMDTASRWQLVNCDVHKGFFHDEKGELCPLSDHFGVAADFVFGPKRPHHCEQQQQQQQQQINSSSAAMEPTNALSRRPCPTTTCIHCDESVGRDGGVAHEYSPAMGCLHEIQSALVDGRKEAIARRAAHLHRAKVAFLALFITLVLRLSLLESNVLWVVILFLTVQSIIEYIMAFYSVTLETAYFAELMHQARLHVHAEQAKEVVY